VALDAADRKLKLVAKQVDHTEVGLVVGLAATVAGCLVAKQPVSEERGIESAEHAPGRATRLRDPTTRIAQQRLAADGG
jgi:hypothetical protein